MSQTTYVPGAATALVGPGCVLLLPGEISEARVAELWPLVRDGADLDVVLEALVTRGLRAWGRSPCCTAGAWSCAAAVAPTWGTTGDS